MVGPEWAFPFISIFPSASGHRELGAWYRVCLRVVGAQWLSTELNGREMRNLGQTSAKTKRWWKAQQRWGRQTWQSGVIFWQRPCCHRDLLGSQKDSAIRAVLLALVLMHPSMKVRAPFRSSHNEFTSVRIYGRLSVRAQRGSLSPTWEHINVSTLFTSW